MLSFEVHLYISTTRVVMWSQMVTIGHKQFPGFYLAKVFNNYLHISIQSFDRNNLRRKPVCIFANWRLFTVFGSLEKLQTQKRQIRSKLVVMKCYALFVHPPLLAP